MTIEIWRHLPTEKQVCFYDGTNAAEIVGWIDDPRKAYVNDLRQLVVVNQGAGFVVDAGDPVILGSDGQVYPCPLTAFYDQYERVGERS